MELRHRLMISNYHTQEEQQQLLVRYRIAAVLLYTVRVHAGIILF
jgi:hypothetical protein